MARAVIQVSTRIMGEMWHHLLESDHGIEQAGFLFVRPTDPDLYRYQTVEWYPVPPDGFRFSSAYHFELTDQTRALVIKRAHDLEASLVEIHSHLSQDPPAFSPSDLYGFREFVPHVWWRLKGRPYFAMVASPGGLDALAWIDGPDAPERLQAVRTGEDVLAPSARSPLRWTSEMGGYSHE